MNTIKLNSKRSETKKDHFKRKKALNQALNEDKSLLRPSTDLNEFGQTLFNTLKNQNGLSNSDNYLLNLLCSEYQLYLKMSDYITKHGAVDNKGKQRSQYQILKSTVNQILKLSQTLNVTPKTRISANYHSNNTDPLKAAVQND